LSKRHNTVSQTTRTEVRRVLSEMSSHAVEDVLKKNNDEGSYEERDEGSESDEGIESDKGRDKETIYIYRECRPRHHPHSDMNLVITTENPNDMGIVYIRPGEEIRVHTITRTNCDCVSYEVEHVVPDSRLCVDEDDVVDEIEVETYTFDALKNYLSGLPVIRWHGHLWI